MSEADRMELSRLYQKLVKLESRLNYDTTLLEQCKALHEKLKARLEQK